MTACAHAPAVDDFCLNDAVPGLEYCPEHAPDDYDPDFLPDFMEHR